MADVCGSVSDSVVLLFMTTLWMFRRQVSTRRITSGSEYLSRISSRYEGSYKNSDNYQCLYNWLPLLLHLLLLPLSIHYNHYQSTTTSTNTTTTSTTTTITTDVTFLCFLIFNKNEILGFFNFLFSIYKRR